MVPLNIIHVIINPQGSKVRLYFTRRLDLQIPIYFRKIKNVSNKKKIVDKCSKQFSGLFKSRQFLIKNIYYYILFV